MASLAFAPFAPRAVRPAFLNVLLAALPASASPQAPCSNSHSGASCFGKSLPPLQEAFARFSLPHPLADIPDTSSFVSKIPVFLLISRGNPLRSPQLHKNHSCRRMRERVIFACWEYPKPTPNRRFRIFHVGMEHIPSRPYFSIPMARYTRFRPFSMRSSALPFGT